MKRTKKIETSKLLVYCVLIFCAVLLCFVLYAWAFQGSMDAAALAGVVTVPASTALGFYFWKAKQENLIKLTKYLGPDGAKEVLTGKEN